MWRHSLTTVSSLSAHHICKVSKSIGGAGTTSALASCLTGRHAPFLNYSSSIADFGLNFAAVNFSSCASSAASASASSLFSSSSASAPAASAAVSWNLSFTPKYLLYEVFNDNITITLNRGDVHNAFNEIVIEEISAAFAHIAAMCTTLSQEASIKSPRCVILRGAGPSFSAGADLNWMKKMKNYSFEENKKDAVLLFEMVSAIRSCPLPVIACVHGAALGGGVGLVAAADIAVAVEGTQFGLTEVRLGLAPAVISRFVMDKIGRNNCSLYFLTGRRFDANEAQRIGLIHFVVKDSDALRQTTEGLLNDLRSSSPAALRASKQLILNCSEVPSVEATKDSVTSIIASLRVSSEGQEGLNAFFEKRKAKWNIAKEKEKAQKPAK